MNEVLSLSWWVWRIGGIAVCAILGCFCLLVARSASFADPALHVHTRKNWGHPKTSLEEGSMPEGVMYLVNTVGLIFLYTTILILANTLFGAIHNWLGRPEYGWQKLVVDVAVVYLLHRLFKRFGLYTYPVVKAPAWWGPKGNIYDLLISSIQAGKPLYLPNANLSGEYLSGANLSGTDLREANLRDADLKRTDLSGANLRDADLKRTDLSGANLSKAYLFGADLRGVDLNFAKYNANTIWPEGFDPVAAGAVLEATE